MFIICFITKNHVLTLQTSIYQKAMLVPVYPKGPWLKLWGALGPPKLVENPGINSEGRIADRSPGIILRRLM